VEEAEILNPRNTRKSWKVSNSARAQHEERAEITWVNPPKHATRGLRSRVGRSGAQDDKSASHAETTCNC
jgi:hypothetical protein